MGLIQVLIFLLLADKGPFDWLKTVNAAEKIGKLEKWHVDRETNATHFKANSKGINEIDLNAFQESVRLTYLDLSFNELKELKVGVFDPLKNLETLWLFNNQLIIIEENLFSTNKKLLDLYLHNNNLIAIAPNEIIRPLSNLWVYNNTCVKTRSVILNFQLESCHNFYDSLKEFETDIKKISKKTVVTAADNQYLIEYIFNGIFMLKVLLHTIFLIILVFMY